MQQEIARTVSIALISILMLFSLILVNKGRRNRPNRYLTLYLVSQIPGIAAFTFFPVCTGKLAIILYAFGQSIAILWGFFYYLFFSSVLDPDFRFRRVHILNLLPGPMAFIYALIALFPFETGTLASSFLFRNACQHLHQLFNLSIISYLATMLYRYRLVSTKQTTVANDRWIRLLAWGFVISCVYVQLANLTGTWLSISYTAIHASSLGVFLLFFSFLFYQGISQPQVFQPEKRAQATEHKTTATANTNHLLYRLDHYMQQHQPYLDPDLKLATLAQALQLTPHLLSQLINQQKGQCFNDYVNRYRTRHAMKLLHTEEYAGDTLFGILLDSGFSSKTTFYKVFRQFNGCSPNEYRQQCRAGATSR